MNALSCLLNAVLDRPFDDVLREQLRDELAATGEWDRSFLTAFVIARPESDGPRLLLADWLERAGEPDRAAFVRTQCALSRLLDIRGPGAATDPSVVALADAARRLAAGLGRQLAVAPVPPGRVAMAPDGDGLCVSGGGVTLEYVRGFVAKIRIASPLFFAHAPELFRRHPLTAVRLTDKEPMPVGGGAWWWTDSCLAPSEPACAARYVPPELYRVLAGGGALPTPTRPGINPADLIFPTVAAAHAALSKACVGYGREAARQAADTGAPG